MSIFRQLLNPQRSIYRAAPFLAVITFLPAFAISEIVGSLSRLGGYDFTSPTFDLSGFGLVLVVVLGPFLETLLLAGGIWLISRFIKSDYLVSITSALIWGILHSLQSPLWGFSIVWPFFVFSRAYMAWRPTGKSNAIGIAWLTHALHNFLGAGLLLLSAQSWGKT